MPPTIEFQARLRRTDFLAHFVRHSLFSQWIVWLLPFGYAAYLGFYLNASEPFAERIRILAVWGGGMFLAIVALVFAIVAIRVWRFDPDGLILEPKTVRISKEDLTIRGSSSEGRFEWSRLAGMKESGRLVILRLLGKPEMHVLLPRRDVPEDALAALRSRFERQA